MEYFLTTLAGASVGILLVSMVVPVGTLRRTSNRVVVAAMAGLIGAGLCGLLVGRFADGMASGVGFATAYLLVPTLVLRLRGRRDASI